MLTNCSCCGKSWRSMHSVKEPGHWPLESKRCRLLWPVTVRNADRFSKAFTARFSSWFLRCHHTLNVSLHCLVKCLAFTACSELRKVLFLALYVTVLIFLFVYEISLATAERICVKFARNTCLVPRSDEFECQGQRLRSPGTKMCYALPSPSGSDGVIGSVYDTL